MGSAVALQAGQLDTNQFAVINFKLQLIAIALYIN